MKIVGLRIEKYIGQSIEGHNCDFEYHDEEFERHILFGILSNNRKVKITLYHEEGECGSGWCCASWGHIDVEEVKNFGGYTYVPKMKLIINDIEPNDEIEDIDNKVFNVSYDGGDCYYPGGYYSINMELFKETVRHKEKRPVWIFKGESNLGKSYLSSRLNELTIYETDSSELLPESIITDVIVLGNKYKFTIDDIKEKLFGEFELCVVKFEKEGK